MKKTVTFFALIFFSQYVIYAQQNTPFSERTQQIIQAEAFNAIAEYQDRINNIGASASKEHEVAKSNVEGFLKLFINRDVSVFNDLDPKKSLSEIYTAETYANNILLWYKNGIHIDLDFDKAVILTIKNHSENIYTIDLAIPKTTTGTYIDNSYVYTTENLHFGIAFSMENNSNPSNFKIARIKEASSSDSDIDIETLHDLKSENIGEEELQNIHNALSSPLNDYCNYLNLIASKDEMESDIQFYKERFLSIFKTADVSVVNDLSKTDAEPISINNYLTQFSKKFSQSNTAIAFDLEKARYGKVIKSDKNTYRTYIYINKKILGKAAGSPFQTQLENIINVEFSKKEDSYTNFKILSITDKNTVQNESKTISATVQKLQKLSRKGIAIGCTFGTGTHSYINNDLTNVPINESTYSWEKENTIGNIMAEIYLSYYPYDKIGFATGIGYSNFETTYRLDEYIVDSQTELLNDFGYYHPTVDAKYDSTITFSTIYIPLHCMIHSSNAGNFGFFSSFGPSIEFIQSASYKASGTYTLAGVLVIPRNSFDILLPENSGGYEKVEPTSGSINAFSKPSVNLNLSAGIEYYINYFTSITLSIYFSYGLNDLEKDKITTQTIFNDIIPHQASHIKKQGVALGVQYKL